MQPGRSIGWQNVLHVFNYNLDYFEIGTLNSPEWVIADRRVAYVTRAIADRTGLWGNHGYEANYQIIYTAGEGPGQPDSHLQQANLAEAPAAQAPSDHQ